MGFTLNNPEKVIFTYSYLFYLPNNLKNLSVKEKNKTIMVKTYMFHIYRKGRSVYLKFEFELW